MDILPELLCDGCDENLTEDKGFYLSPGETLTAFCPPCFQRLRDFPKYVEDGDFECITCFQWHMSGPFWKIGQMDMCVKCYDSTPLENLFILVDKNNKEYIYTDREYLYFYKEKELVIPEAIKDRIFFGTETFKQDAECVVRPPYIDWNAATWLQIGKTTDCFEYSSADLGFCVNCDPDKPSEVASMCIDDHGRMALNVVFPTVEDFLEAERKWKENLLPEEERDKLKDELDKEFKETYSACNEKIMKSTDSFAVYTRLENNLATYYG